MEQRGIAIENSGNVRTSNGCITATGCTPGSFILSELVGAAAPTVTPLANGIDNNPTGTRPQAITNPVQAVAVPFLNSVPRKQPRK